MTRVKAITAIKVNDHREFVEKGTLWRQFAHHPGTVKKQEALGINNKLTQNISLHERERKRRKKRNFLHSWNYKLKTEEKNV